MSLWVKVFLNILYAIITLLLVILLWNNTAILIVFLLMVGVGMYFISPTPISLAIYIISFVIGPLAESAAIYSGIWTYTNPVIIGLPLWLPFAWANCGLCIKNTVDLSQEILTIHK